MSGALTKIICMCTGFTMFRFCYTNADRPERWCLMHCVFPVLIVYEVLMIIITVNFYFKSDDTTNASSEEENGDFATSFYVLRGILKVIIYFFTIVLAIVLAMLTAIMC